MQFIDEIKVPRARGEGADASIQLLRGDLAAIPAEHPVDLLVVSAFPDSYTPNPGTLFEGLYRRGLDLGQVARHKSEDERARLGCWLSQPMPHDVVERFHFHRILCFEPSHPSFVERSRVDDIAANVGFVFRCLNNFVIPGLKHERDFHIAKVAMPILATGNQRVPLEALFPQLLEAAIFWLQQGLPIQELKLVVFQPPHVSEATGIFRRIKSQLHPVQLRQGRSIEPAALDSSWEAQLAKRLQREVIEICSRSLRQDLLAAATDSEKSLLERLFERIDDNTSNWDNGQPGATTSSTLEYDLFISYAHEHEAEVSEFIKVIQSHSPTLRVFYDRTSIPPGGQWIRMISDAVQRTRKFVAILSPQYSASPVCWDEFQCAKLKEYNTRQSVIQTIRLFKEDPLPPIMGIYSYVDCVQGDLEKLRQAAARVIQ
jgi:hypothetical protein